MQFNHIAKSKTIMLMTMLLLAYGYDGIRVYNQRCDDSRRGWTLGKIYFNFLLSYEIKNYLM